MTEFSALPGENVVGDSPTRTDSASAKKYEVAPLGASPQSKQLTPKKMSVKLILHLAHRFLLFQFAIGYVGISFGASYTAMLLLRGNINPWNEPEDDTLPLIAGYLGTKSLRESPLVKDTLLDSTAPLNTSIFLEDNKTVLFTQCTDIHESIQNVFSDSFMRSVYEAITVGTSYNVTEIAPSKIELIAPIVDCQASTMDSDDVTSAKFFFLVRDRANPDLVSILIAYVSNQQFRSKDQSGAASVATIQLVSDMRETGLDERFHFIVSLGYPYQKLNFRKYAFLNLTEEGLATLQLVPPPGRREIRKTIETACREGFYIKGETEQSNVNNYQWLIESDAVNAVARWRWVSRPVLHDSWAWVHGIQFFIAMALLSNLSILCLATYRNFLTGHRWIGDAYVSISTSQYVTFAAVLVSWYMNEFWSVREFAYSTAFKLYGYKSLMAYDLHMRADFFTLYLGASGFIGHLLRERIDPILATICFLVGYDLRVEILTKLFPSISDEAIAYSEYIYSKNISPRLPDQDKISPMGFWTTHALFDPNYTFLFQCLLPIYATLVFVLAYAVARKIHRHVYPDKVHVQRDTVGTATSENEQSFIAQKRVLTLFEVATGAKLEHRFGVMSDFETCVFIRGTKFASPDGIYSTGFVIANKKFLLQTSDYWSIVLMKLLGRRIRNVYVYDVSGQSVNQTARLVYPHTFSVADLISIDVSTLS